MTNEQKSKCKVIIHAHAATAAAGNALPVPGLGIAVDTVTMTTMCMALCSVFGGNITEKVAKTMAINAIKQGMLKQPIKTVTKELSKFVPFLGQLVASTISVAILEAYALLQKDYLILKQVFTSFLNKNIFLSLSIKVYSFKINLL